MQYFKINYNKLENLRQINFHKFILFIGINILILLISSIFIYASHTLKAYGIYKDNVLHVTINNELSDVVKNNEELIFNGINTKYKIINYGNYEIVDNNIYQELDLTIDNVFYDNEVGEVKISYHKERLIKFILELFK